MEQNICQNIDLYQETLVIDFKLSRNWKRRALQKYHLNQLAYSFVAWSKMSFDRGYKRSIDVNASKLRLGYGTASEKDIM